MIQILLQKITHRVHRGPELWEHNYIKWVVELKFWSSKIIFFSPLPPLQGKPNSETWKLFLLLFCSFFVILFVSGEISGDFFLLWGNFIQILIRIRIWFDCSTSRLLIFSVYYQRGRNSTQKLLQCVLKFFIQYISFSFHLVHLKILKVLRNHDQTKPWFWSKSDWNYILYAVRWRTATLVTI